MVFHKRTYFYIFENIYKNRWNNSLYIFAIMISIFLMGGLGNQLFQIATVIAYCIQNKCDFVLPYSETLTTGMVRPTYWNTFLIQLKKFTTAENPSLHNNFLFNLPKYYEPGFQYHEIPNNLENTLFYGYFQSYKYFEMYREKVLNVMGITNLRSSIKIEYSNLVESGEPSISIHFRLGDYKEKQQFHPVLKEEYYEKALQIIPKEYLQYAKVLYFCEEEDRSYVDDIMTRLYEKYNIRIPIYVDSNIPDWKQMLIMSNCQINIIANSSYSWWAAYINDDPKKTVIYPKTWFGSAIPHNTCDMFPNNWISI